MNRVQITLMVVPWVLGAMALGASEIGKQAASGLKSEERRERERTGDEIRTQRKSLVSELVDLATTKVERLDPHDRTSLYPWHDSKHLAILLLGDLRAVEGIPVLLGELRYKNPRSLFVSEPLGIDGMYPAVESLSKIGMPAVGPTIKKLGSYEKDGLGRELCCWVINKVLGRRLGRLRLEIAIEEVREAKVKRNLQAALAYFKTPEEKAAEEEAGGA